MDTFDKIMISAMFGALFTLLYYNFTATKDTLEAVQAIKKECGDAIN